MQARTDTHRLLSHAMADIYVGPDSQHWILHEKLLCHHSPVLRSHFYKKGSPSSTFGLPEESEEAFKLLVGWLYSSTLHFPLQESEIGPLLDLYLLGARLEMAALEADVVDTVRAFYQHNNTYPGLRRVQYIYANTSQDNPMREMIVGAVARQLTLAETIPAWWANALKKNGELAVDIIRAIQEWHLESRSVPDVREGREAHFSSIEENKSMEGEPSNHGNGDLAEPQKNGKDGERSEVAFGESAAGEVSGRE